MPRAPKKCGHPGCETRVTARTYCDAHQPDNWATSRHRPSTRASRALRTRILTRDPICTCPGCKACSTAICCLRPSTQDDHVIPLAEGGTDHESNHAGKCKPCHDIKSQAEATRARQRNRT